MKESQKAVAQTHYTTAVQLPNLQILKEVEKILKELDPPETNNTLTPAHTPVAMQKTIIDSLKEKFPLLQSEIDQIGNDYDFATETRKLWDASAWLNTRKNVAADNHDSIIKSTNAIANISRYTLGY